MLSYNPLPNDVESGWEREKSPEPELDYDVASRQLRQGFIRKVFGILAAQLALTAAVTLFFIKSSEAKIYVAQNPWTLYTALGASFGLLLTLGFSETLRRRHPWNIFALALFTIAESVLIAFTSSMFDARIVLLAVALTGGAALALAAFAMQTRVDFTASAGLLMSLLTVLILGGLLQIFLHLRWLHLLVTIGGASLFAVYLVFDIQLMVDGGKYSISPDEYVFAAINLYLDIINLFLYILQILNDFNRD